MVSSDDASPPTGHLGHGDWWHLCRLRVFVPSLPAVFSVRQSPHNMVFESIGKLSGQTGWSASVSRLRGRSRVLSTCSAPATPARVPPTLRVRSVQAAGPRQYFLVETVIPVINPVTELPADPRPRQSVSFLLQFPVISLLFQFLHFSPSCPTVVDLFAEDATGLVARVDALSDFAFAVEINPR